MSFKCLFEEDAGPLTKQVVLLLMLLSVCLHSEADTLHFSNGRSVQGIIAEGSGTLLLDLATGGQVVIPTALVANVEYGEIVPTDTPTPTFAPQMTFTPTPTPTIVYTPKQRYKDKTVLEAYKKKWSVVEEERKKEEETRQQRQQGQRRRDPDLMMQEFDPAMMGPI